MVDLVFAFRQHRTAVTLDKESPDWSRSEMLPKAVWS